MLSPQCRQNVEMHQENCLILSYFKKWMFCSKIWVFPRVFLLGNIESRFAEVPFLVGCVCLYIEKHILNRTLADPAISICL